MIARRRAAPLLLALAAAAVLPACGRKNLPVAPRPTAVGGALAPAAEESPASVPSFQRAARITTETDLTVSPAEVSRVPGAPKKSFPLDFLLN